MNNPPNLFIKKLQKNCFARLAILEIILFHGLIVTEACTTSIFEIENEGQY